MKKNIILALCCSSLLAFTACSDDYNDASSKHVYGESEEPYLKANENAHVSDTLKVNITNKIGYFKINITDATAPMVVDLSDERHAAVFEQQLGMSLDAALQGTEDGSIVFYPINVSRNKWVKMEPNAPTGTGWYFNSASQPCAADDADAQVIVSLDKSTKKLTITPLATARGGVSLATNVGFAKNGPDYDEYVRFSTVCGIEDPTAINVEYTFSYAGSLDYILPDRVDDSGAITSYRYGENIRDIFGMEWDEFKAALLRGDIEFQLLNPEDGSRVNGGSIDKVYYLNLAGAEVENEQAVDWAVTVRYEEDDVNGDKVTIPYNTELAYGTAGALKFGFIDVADASKRFVFTVDYYIGDLGR